jgi:hypothetical protein
MTRFWVPHFPGCEPLSLNNNPLSRSHRYDYGIRGNVLNVWKGSGEESVHSSVFAPAPHGLSPACCLRMKV